MRARFLRGVGAGIAGAVLLAVLIAALLVYSGAYNVSAAAGHTAFGRWLLETVLRNSVEARAEGGEPRQFTDEMIRAGAGEYKAMCQQCHGGPGVSREEWAEGLVPMPPNLAREATEWKPAEIHWIVTNGIKMTAMPAFGPTHDEQTVWNITAFVEQLPEMSKETYDAFPSGHGGEESSETHSHSH